MDESAKKAYFFWKVKCFRLKTLKEKVWGTFFAKNVTYRVVEVTIILEHFKFGQKRKKLYILSDSKLFEIIIGHSKPLKVKVRSKTLQHG